MREKLWFKYLDFWCNKKTLIGSGLTIPFLVGLEITLNPENKNYNLITFLREIKHFDFYPFVICLRVCPQINEIICCLDNLSEYEKKYYVNFGNIYFSIPEIKEISDYETFELIINNKYEQKIQDKLYTKENGEWFTFTTEKLNEIKLRIC